MERYSLSEVQATAILDMQLRRLAALERRKLQEEYAELQDKIAELQAILDDPSKVRASSRRSCSTSSAASPTPGGRDPPRRGRAVDRGPDRGRAGGGHRDQDRLREAGRPRRLPGSEPGRPRGPGANLKEDDIVQFLAITNTTGCCSSPTRAGSTG